MELLDGVNLDERKALEQLQSSANYRYHFWRFLQSISHDAINHNLRNLGSLIIQLQCLLLLSTRPEEPSSRVGNEFWELFTFCKRTNPLKLDLEKKVFIIGTQARALISFDNIPVSHRKNILNYFSFNQAPNRTPLAYETKNPTISIAESESLAKPSENLQKLLDLCKPGKEQAKCFERIGTIAFSMLFPNELGNPVIQPRTANGLEIRDVIYPIKDISMPPWNNIFHKYKQANHLVIDFKNYNEDLGQDEVNRVTQYLNIATGYFGLIWTRGNISKNAYEAQRLNYSSSTKLVLLLQDKDVIEMFRCQEDGNKPYDILQKLETDFVSKFHQ